MTFYSSAARRRHQKPLAYAVVGSLLASCVAAGCGGGSERKVPVPYDAAGAAGEAGATSGGNGNAAGSDVTGRPGGSGGLPAGEGGSGATNPGDAGASGAEPTATAGTAGTAGSGGASGGSGTNGGSSGNSGSAGAAQTCVADLQNDAANCGVCGRSCGAGGVCTHAHCALGLVKQLIGPSGVAVDDTYVYYGSRLGGTVNRVPLAGGAPEPLITTGVAAHVEMLLLVGSNLVWTTNSDQQVLKAAKAGGSAVQLSTTEKIPYGIASNGTDVFWTNHYQVANSIGHALIAGTTTKNPVISGSPEVTYPTYVASDDTYIYWGNAGSSGKDASVYRAKLDGSLPVAIAKNQDPVYGIAVDATTVYFTTTSGLVASVPKDSDGSVAPTTVDQGNFIYNIVVDATDLYWLDEGLAAVRHRAKAGGTAETIASTKLPDIDPYLGSTTYLTLDATHVYWVDSGTQYGHGAVLSVTRN